DTLYLSDSAHTIKLDYFQGPRYELALQLYWNQPDSPARIFPGQGFILYPPPPRSWWWLWLLAAVAVITTLFFLLRKRLKKNKMSAASPRTLVPVAVLILQFFAFPARSQFLKNVLNSVKQTAQNRANNKTTQVTNGTIDKVESVGASGTTSPATGSTAAGATSPTSGTSGVGGAGSGSNTPPDKDSDSSYLSLSLSATRIITGSLVTISGMSIKFGTMKDVQMTVKGNAGTETKTIPLTDSGHFKTTWGTGIAGEYQITIISSNRKSSKTVTIKVFRLMSMDSVVQKNKEETQKAYDNAKHWIDLTKTKLGPSDAQALQKKADDLDKKVTQTQQFFDDLAALGKSLDKLQQAQGGGNMSPQLSQDFTKLTTELSTQATNMETMNNAAAHQPYDNTICEYLQMISEACAAFSTFTNFFEPEGTILLSITDIGKNVALDKGVPMAAGAAASSANGTASDMAKEAAKFSATTVIDYKSLSGNMSKAGFTGDIVTMCTNYIMSKYCGMLSGDMSEDYKCTFLNANNAKWWEYTYHNDATVKLRYLKSAATSTLIKMKGNIEGNATQFTIFQKVSEMDDFKKAMKGRANIFSICLYAPPTMPAATSQADAKTGFGA
ncbi:MAG TPA: hypothetical protein VHW43_13065, partial [Puia sp.]|nr:hypothetical protein [Puia sp.]